MTVGERSYGGRVDAGAALRNAVLAVLDGRPAAGWGRNVEVVGQLGGFDVGVERSGYGLDDRGTSELVVLRPGVGEKGSSGQTETGSEVLPLRHLPLERPEVARSDPTGLIAKLEGRIARIEETAANYRSQAEASRTEAAAIAARLGRDFEHTNRLAWLRRRLSQIDEALMPPEPQAGPDNPGMTSPDPGMNAPAQVGTGADNEGPPVPEPGHHNGPARPADLAETHLAVPTPASGETISSSLNHDGPTTAAPPGGHLHSSVSPGRYRPAVDATVHQRHDLYVRLQEAIRAPEATPDI